MTDAEDPTIQNCPSNQSLETNLGKSTAVVNWTNPIATDNSRQHPTVTCEAESGSQFGIGETKVICEAVDVAGNRATCVFTVNIQGNLILFKMHFFKDTTVLTCSHETRTESGKLLFLFCKDIKYLKFKL